jgi:hypothetical protein
MTLNMDRYKNDLEALIKFGSDLQSAIEHECYPEEFRAQLVKSLNRVQAQDVLPGSSLICFGIDKGTGAHRHP